MAKQPPTSQEQPEGLLRSDCSADPPSSTAVEGERRWVRTADLYIGPKKPPDTQDYVWIEVPPATALDEARRDAEELRHAWQAQTAEGTERLQIQQARAEAAEQREAELRAQIDKALGYLDEKNHGLARIALASALQADPSGRERGGVMSWEPHPDLTWNELEDEATKRDALLRELLQRVKFLEEEVTSAWHKGPDTRPLHEVLGLSEDEYAVWMRNPSEFYSRFEP